MKKSIVLYLDSFEYLKELSDSDFGILFKAVFSYSTTGDSMQKNHALYLAFAPIKNQLDRDNEKYKKTCNTNKISGSKGGKRKVANASARKRTQTNVADNDNNNDIDNKNNNDIEKRKVNFASSLKPFLSLYGKDTLNDFYLYWTEHSTNGKKLRHEKQTVFDIGRRLITWTKNETKFGSSKPDNTEVENVMKSILKYKS